MLSIQFHDMYKKKWMPSIQVTYNNESSKDLECWWNKFLTKINNSTLWAWTQNNLKQQVHTILASTLRRRETSVEHLLRVAAVVVGNLHPGGTSPKRSCTESRLHQQLSQRDLRDPWLRHSGGHLVYEACTGIYRTQNVETVKVYLRDSLVSTCEEFQCNATHIYSFKHFKKKNVWN